MCMMFALGMMSCGDIDNMDVTLMPPFPVV